MMGLTCVLWCGSVSDLAILLSFYGCEPPKRCRSLGRDKRFQEAYYVSYVGFCRDIEPICGGRDMETRWVDGPMGHCLNQAREGAGRWLWVGGWGREAHHDTPPCLDVDQLNQLYVCGSASSLASSLTGLSHSLSPCVRPGSVSWRSSGTSVPPPSPSASDGCGETSRWEEGHLQT